MRMNLARALPCTRWPGVPCTHTLGLLTRQPTCITMALHEYPFLQSLLQQSNNCIALYLNLRHLESNSGRKYINTMLIIRTLKFRKTADRVGEYTTTSNLAEGDTEPLYILPHGTSKLITLCLRIR